MTMIELPKKYCEEMKELLKDEYEDYMHSLNEAHLPSLRVNELKISVDEFLEIFPYSLKPIPWCHNGFYYDEKDSVTKHPYYYAGLYYIQEASAMLPAESLPIEKGDRVLDICAAPGGKSTELGVKLQDTGVLFSNDISYSRCQALLKNLERFGIRNSYVTSEAPEKLSQYFSSYFDKILIDAPCSGEGMFRKDPHLIQSWIEHDSSYYVPIQKSIVENAIKMLRPGGMILYSTCTFSESEDEEIIQYALSLDTSLKVVPLKQYPGFTQNAFGTKLFPHHVQGEGHFVSLLVKQGNVIQLSKKEKPYHFDYDNIHASFENCLYQEIKDRCYVMKETNVDLSGLRIMRSGILLGEKKKNRFEFDEALPMYLRENEYSNVIHLECDDIRIIKYLKGETIQIDDTNIKDGYAMVCVDQYPLGFVKVSKGTCKNKYSKYWRMQ